MEGNKGFWLIAIYFCLAIYLLPMFSPNGSADELARWATTASLVENLSFEIGWARNLIGEKPAAVQIDEKFYADKPPGFSVLSIPFYALTRIFIGEPTPENLCISWFVMRFFLASLPLVWLALWLYSRDSDEISLAVLLFATPLFPFSLTFLPYVLTAILLYLTFRLLYDSPRIFLRNCFAAGFISGIALTCDYSALICILVFGVGLFVADKTERWRYLFFFSLGFFPFAALVLLYNYAVFGSPFALFFDLQTFPETAKIVGQDKLSFAFPTLSNIYLWLFSPSRGLFFYTPVLLLSVVTFFTSRENKTLRYRVKVAAILVSFLAMCGHSATDGGWTFGARYLIFVLPLLLDSFFDGEIYDLSNLWQGILFAVSFVFCTIPMLTFPLAPPEFKYPHNNFWRKLLLEENLFVPNLAELVGFHKSFWLLLPIIILLLTAFFIVCRNARRPQKFLIGAICGFLIAGFYLFLPNLDQNIENKQKRQEIVRFIR